MSICFDRQPRYRALPPGYVWGAFFRIPALTLEGASVSVKGDGYGRYPPTHACSPLPFFRLPPMHLKRVLGEGRRSLWFAPAQADRSLGFSARALSLGFNNPFGNASVFRKGDII